MTESEASLMVKQALPCPFCGERLIAHSDHHGYWLAHKEEPGPCYASTFQLLDQTDLLSWNTRAEHQRGKRCPKCEAPMIHERLRGYVCFRGCQP